MKIIKKFFSKLFKKDQDSSDPSEFEEIRKPQFDSLPDSGDDDEEEYEESESPNLEPTLEVRIEDIQKQASESEEEADEYDDEEDEEPIDFSNVQEISVDKSEPQEFQSAEDALGTQTEDEESEESEEEVQEFTGDDEDEFDEFSDDDNIEEELEKTREISRAELANAFNSDDDDDDDDRQTLSSFQIFDAQKEKKKFNLKVPNFNLKSKFNSVKDFSLNFIKKITRKESYQNFSAKDFSFKEFLEKLQIEETFKSVFALKNRPEIHKSFIFCALFIVSYIGGKTTGLFLQNLLTKPYVESVSALNTSNSGKALKDNVNTILTSNLFNAKKQYDQQVKVADKPKEAKKKNLVCDTADKKSSLPITLKSTIVLQDSVKSIASVQVRGSSKPMDLRVGDKVNGQALISKIDRLKIIFKNLETDQCEFVESKNKEKKVAKTQYKILSPKAGRKAINAKKDDRIQNNGDNFKIKKSLRDEMLGNISEVLTQARAIQIKNSDGSLSFKMTDVVPGSIYSHLNIQDGDIIDEINGKKFKNLNEVMSLFGQLKSNDNYEIKLRRDGISKTLNYDFQ